MMNTMQYASRLLQIWKTYTLGRGDRVGYMPYRLWVEPTNRCNLACVMCPNKDFKESELGFMEWDLYKKIIDEAENFVYDINLHHRGEPTLHKDLPRMIRYAREKGIPVKLHTNGTTLTESMAESIMEAGLSLISFSIDGYNAPNYEKIRVGAKFDRVMKNITRFLEIRRRKGLSGPRTVVEVMEFEKEPFTSGEKQAFIDSLKSRGLDRLIIKKPHNWAGSVGLDTFDTARFSACTFPWHAQVILWDGRVGPCPHDYFAKIILGDVRKDSLKSIFNSTETCAL